MEEKKQGFFEKILKGLTKTSNNILTGFDNIFNLTEIDDGFYEELEEILIMADIGVRTTEKIVEKLKTRIRDERIKEPNKVKELLREILKDMLKTDEDLYEFEEKKSIVLIVGVNGVGKTTTIGKMANNYTHDGKKVILAAGDTFRAAAIEQLEQWAAKVGVPIVKSAPNADPGAVVFDAIQSMKSKDGDLLLCDTSGRLHNKKNLMAELGKIYKIIDKNYEGVHKEVLLVLDATTGQNAVIQAIEFGKVTQIDGIVLTKLDGSAKGGVAIAIKDQLDIPIKYIGVGEGESDLVRFDSSSFVDAIFGDND